MLKKVKNFLINFTITIVSFVLVLAIAEYLLAPFILPYMPTGFLLSGEREVRFLGQHSVKNGLLPESPYIALFGDSYAEGYGDWLSGDNGGNRDSDHHSANVINNLTGIDVATYGKSGNDNIKGNYIYPLYISRRLEKLRFDLKKPDTIIYYFYEGNDFWDNLGFNNTYCAGMQVNQSNIEEYKEIVRDVKEDIANGSPRRLKEYFPLFNTARRIIKYGILAPVAKSFKDQNIQGGYVTKIDVAGKTVALPDSLQAPPLGMSEERYLSALYTFQASLELSEEVYPKARKIVVYIPSPLICYNVVSEKVHLQYGGPLFDTSLIKPANLKLVQDIRDVSLKAGFEFFDATPDLYELGQKEFIHGPIDWKHFNRAGYEQLGQSVVNYLQGSKQGRR